MVIMLVHGQLIIRVIQVLFICPFFLQVRVWVIKPTNLDVAICLQTDAKS
jgi:hypothetical protein